MSEVIQFKYAKVRFDDYSKEITTVPVTLIKENIDSACHIKPKNEDDFDKKKLYYCQKLCTDECTDKHIHHSYVSCIVLFLGESIKAINKKMESEKHRFPRILKDLESERDLESSRPHTSTAEMQGPRVVICCRSRVLRENNANQANIEDTMVRQDRAAIDSDLAGGAAVDSEHASDENDSEHCSSKGYIKPLIVRAIKYYDEKDSPDYHEKQKRFQRLSDEHCYIGEGVFTSHAAFQMMLVGDPPKVARDLASMIWGNELKYRCLDADRVNNPRFKLLEMNLVRLYISVYYNDLLNKRQNMKIEVKAQHLYKCMEYLKNKIRDLRSPRKKKEKVGQKHRS